MTLLWRMSYTDELINSAVTLSAVRDVTQQITGLLTSSHKRLVDVDEDNAGATEAFLKTHLPHLSVLFGKSQAIHTTRAP